MKAGGGKNKGSGFERLVCQKLSLWISAGERDDLFWRSSMSGGRASVKFKKGGSNITQCGDITAIDPLGSPLTDKFLISCKFYRSLQLEGAMLGNKSGLNNFWLECVVEALRYKKMPMLIAKQNNTAPILCLDDAGIVHFKLTSTKAICQLPGAGGGMLIFWLERFLALTSTAPRPRIRLRN